MTHCHSGSPSILACLGKSWESVCTVWMSHHIYRAASLNVVRTKASQQSHYVTFLSVCPSVLFVNICCHGRMTVQAHCCSDLGGREGDLFVHGFGKVSVTKTSHSADIVGNIVFTLVYSWWRVGTVATASFSEEWLWTHMHEGLMNLLMEVSGGSAGKLSDCSCKHRHQGSFSHQSCQSSWTQL